SELVEAGGEIPLGRNIESNSLLMKGKIEQWGGEALLFPITPDDPEAIEATLRKAAAEADIIVLNAGSSKGSDDWSLEILEQIGTVLYHQTSHGPGHHSSASVLEGTPVIGISGPPGGAAFTTDFYLRPAMRKFLGLDPYATSIPVKLAAEFAGKGPGMGGAKGAAGKIAGEQRPSEESPFVGIKQMMLEVGEDGTILATPASGTHLEPLEAEQARAYFGLATGADGSRPQAGDVIEVTLRPEWS
ncbi:MAG: molybdopterin biosynthesis protein, partial [Eggerthellaceae bacterium]|nr:molybdopterin biosynthesis protein [Eggerthellaceae bacterium]